MTSAFTSLKSVFRATCGVTLTLAVGLAGCSADRTEYYTADDFADVPKADVHIHIYTDQPYFVEQAQRDNFRLVNIAVDLDNEMDEVRRQWHFIKEQQTKHPEVLASVTSFSMEGFDEPGWFERTTAWLDSCFEDGAFAVKVWKNIGMSYRDSSGALVMIDDERLNPVFRELAERGIPVFGHLGEPRNCWLPLEEMTTNNDRRYFEEHPQYHMYKHPEFPSYEDQIAARDRMLENNPDLTFVAVHMASLEWDVDELAARLDRFPNMSVDLAARMGQVFHQTHLDRERVRNFFIKYQDRILYATDLYTGGEENPEDLSKKMHDTWTRDWKFFVTDDTLTSGLVNEPYQGLKLPREVVDKIYIGNAKRFF